MDTVVSKGFAVTHSVEAHCSACKIDYANLQDVPRTAVLKACCKYTFIAS